MSPSLSRRKNTFPEVAWFLPFVPRGTQGKQPPQGPGRGRSGSGEEDHLEQKTLEETLRLAGGVPVVRTAYARCTHSGEVHEKENYGVSQRPPSPILVSLFPSISHPCGMIVQTANLVDSSKDNRSREHEGATCQISPTAQAVPI